MSLMKNIISSQSRAKRQEYYKRNRSIILRKQREWRQRNAVKLKRYRRRYKRKVKAGMHIPKKRAKAGMSYVFLGPVSQSSSGMPSQQGTVLYQLERRV